MAEKARQPLSWDMRVLAGKGLVEMPLLKSCKNIYDQHQNAHAGFV